MRSKKKFLGCVDKNTPYVQLYEIEDNPKVIQVWFDPSRFLWKSWVYQGDLVEDVKHGSNGHWQIDAKNADIGLIQIMENPTRDEDPNYGSDQAIVEVINTILKNEKSAAV